MHVSCYKSDLLWTSIINLPVKHPSFTFYSDNNALIRCIEEVLELGKDRNYVSHAQSEMLRTIPRRLDLCKNSELKAFFFLNNDEPADTECVYFRV